MHLVGRKGYLAEFRQTSHDLAESFSRFPLAVNLAVHDILSRYRGSVLGPWWITIATMTLVLGMGVFYASLLHQEVKDFLPYVAIGMVVWGFLSASISEGGDSFVTGGSMIKQSAIPLPMFILRTLVRNLINLGHQVVIIVAVMVWFKIFPGAGMLWAVPGLMLMVVNLGWIGLFLAVVSTRFRDLPQIVAALLQFAFFLSPVFWTPTPKLAHSPALTLNPFYFSIESIRGPLLHGAMPPNTLVILALIAVFGWIAALLVYNDTRRRVVHYL